MFDICARGYAAMLVAAHLLSSELLSVLRDVVSQSVCEVIHLVRSAVSYACRCVIVTYLEPECSCGHLENQQHMHQALTSMQPNSRAHKWQMSLG